MGKTLYFFLSDQSLQYSTFQNMVAIVDTVAKKDRATIRSSKKVRKLWNSCLCKELTSRIRTLFEKHDLAKQYR